ncbi:MAG: Uma2 family endonuclease [Armatimonadota bacterium]|nr:Uma2 family endonuclease [Armatimonadota bacterium]
MSRQKLVLTYDDYLRMPDDRTRKEIIGGELFVAAAPSPAHQRVVVHVAASLLAAARTHGLGEVLVAPLDVVLSRTDVVQPDVVFVAAPRRAIVGEAAIHGAPDLIVEVVSPSTRKVDRRRKFDLYARAGVAEYWIVDLDGHLVDIYGLAGGAYRLERRVVEGELARSSRFPQLVVDPAGAWT